MMNFDLPARLLFMACVVALTLGAFGHAERALRKAGESVDEPGYRNLIAGLSADDMEGRQPGTVGEQRTIEYLEEQDIHVVSAGPGPDAERISEAALGMEFCITRAEAGELVGLLGGLHPAEGEFLNFYEEFAEEPLARAGAAMLDGLEYLKRACGFLATDDERLLLFVG